MDGTGRLFTRFARALPDWIETETVRYPTQHYLSENELLPMIRNALPRAEPFVLLAESYSTRMAFRLSSEAHKDLKALVICAGFLDSPVKGLLRRLASLSAPVIFRLPTPTPVIRTVLLGDGAPADLVEEIRRVVRSVEPRVLSKRLRSILCFDDASQMTAPPVPLLCLLARNDRLVSRSSVERILKVRSDATVVEIDGPHLILQREPLASARAIVTFLESLVQN
jgi:pimeloyl-[acyl-carrier protein] methyl ester esterase